MKNELTASILVTCGASPAHASKYVAPINSRLETYKVNTFLRLAHFLSQILHESIGLSATVENLNYSAKALCDTWPKRFPTLEFAKLYARQPEKIANYVYANRGGNGPPESGDGWKYRGRGPMQNTFKDKYIRLFELTGIDYVTHPEYMERPDDGMMSAFVFWKDNELNALADTDNPDALTRKINGGYNGLAERKILLAKCKKALAPLFSED
ncbi:hypothetical protein GCM10028808_73380 [Spirosoma migulaei]